MVRFERRGRLAELPDDLVGGSVQLILLDLFRTPQHLNHIVVDTDETPGETIRLSRCQWDDRLCGAL
jgi:hypothetical protein